MSIRKKILAALLLIMVLIGSVSAEDPVSFVNLAHYGVWNVSGSRAMTITAKREETISYRVASQVGGVIFQEVAVPAESAQGRPVSIEYMADQPDGQRLIVTIGDTAVTADIYDWQLIPTARFAATEYTACVTLLGHPYTPAEREDHEKYRNTIMWAEFHPDFINTLVGMNLFFVDAMLVDGNTNRMRGITDTLNGVIPGYNDISFDRKESEVNASYIPELINLSGNVNSYIYTDYGTTIRYKISGERLVFSGEPSYLFMLINDRTRTVTVRETLNAQILEKIDRVRAINPIIYRTAEETAQWAAFFRMVKEQNPQAWERFTAQISGVLPETGITTPRSWMRE